MIKQFERVKTITKKIKFDLFLPFKNRKSRPIFKLVNTPFPSNLYPIRTYSENGEVYVYCADKAVYKQHNGTFVKTEIATSSAEPTLITVIINGVKTVIKAPFGKDAINLNGRLILSDDTKVYVSKKGDIDWVNLTEQDFFVIGFADSEGKIQGMLSSGENLLVLTEKSLFKVSRIDGDITVKLISSPAFNVLKNTFARCGNKACFLSGDKLCVIKNDKITIEKTALDGVSFSIADKPGTALNTYLLPIYLGGGRSMFIYHFDSENNQIISDNTQALSRQDGYVIGGGYLRKFQYEYYEAGLLGTTPDPEDMGTCKQKTITEIEACVKGSATLRISGDFGEKDVKLIEGCNMLRVNLTSKRFTFTRIFQSNDFTLEEITLKYIVHEDSKNAI